MSSQSRILATTDLSAPARHAVERAFLLAESNCGEIHVLHALELGALEACLEEMQLGWSISVKATLIDDARERLKQLAGELGKRQGLAASPHVVVGNPLSVIAAEADSLDASLVVLGARGDSFLRRALLGSTAARLLRKSTRRPVLVVKQPPRESYRNVLVAVDFSPVSIAAVRLAKQLAPKAQLTLLHAFELPYEGKMRFAGVDDLLIRQYLMKGTETRRKRLNDLLNAAGVGATDCSVRILHGDPSQQILLMEQEVDADLIVIGKHGTHLAEEMLLGSVTKHVLADSQCDVLVICDPREVVD